MVGYDLSEMATLATVIGVPVAIGAYWFNARATRLAHMHKLFGDYLRMKFDFTVAGRPAALRSQLSAFKLYTLDEMFLWVERERRFAWLPGYRAALDAWEKTVNFHLEIEDFDDIEKTFIHRNCYTPKFFDRWEELNATNPNFEKAKLKTGEPTIA